MTLTSILSILFILATFLQLFYWWGIFARLAFFKTKKERPRTKEQPVSIVICARNEAENLKKNLPHILNQTYRSFEIVVVNHNSSDETATILQAFQKKIPTLHIINYYNMKAGKKQALSAGIKAAQFPTLLLTDADCRPTSRFWLRDMQQAIDVQKDIGLGYAPHYDYPGFLNRLVRFETVYTATQYLSFALAGIPYMGVGRNLVYKKSLFFLTDGFRNHEHIASGDDDLFINAVARRDNVKVILNPETFMYSEPERTWKRWFNQKRRHLSTGTQYRFIHQVLLGLLSLSHFSHYFIAMVLYCLDSSTMVMIITLFLIRISTVWILYGFILHRLRESRLFWWIPLLDALWVLYYLVFAPFLFTRNTKTWK